MIKEQKDSTNQIKHYQIILLSCFFCCILMLNSNYVNKNREMIRLDKEREVLFNHLIQQRQLSEDSSSTDEICSRASKDLNEYYETADLSKIDLEDGPIKAEDKNEGYMKALINIVRTMADDSEEDSNPNPSPSPGGRRRNLRNLGGASDIDIELTNAGVQHKKGKVMEFKFLKL